MKIEINHPENISPPPQKSFKSPEQTQHHRNNPNPFLRNPKHFRKHLNHSPKNLNPSQKNLNLPEKLSLPKNCITITETISNTRTKSQPLPEKSLPNVKNSQSLLKKSQPPIPPKKIFNPP